MRVNTDTTNNIHLNDRASSRSAPSQIFGGRREVILLGLPLILILMAWLEHIFDWNHSDNFQSELTVIVNVVFLSSLHCIFTFQMAFTNPTYRQIIRSHRGKWSEALLIFFAGLFIFLQFLQDFSNPLVGQIVFFGLTTFVYYHTARQFLGLSLIYNMNARKEAQLTPTQLKNLSKAESLEKRGTYVHIFGMSLQTAVIFLYESQGLQMPVWIRHVMVGIGAILIAAMIYRYRQISPQLFRNKIIFMFRYFLMLISFYSFWAFMGTKIVHGIEYYMIYKRIQTHNKEPVKSPISLQALTYILALVLIVTNFMSEPIGFRFNKDGFTDKALLVVAGALNWFHYYLDGILFAMKRNDVRSQTGHWLLSDSDRS